MLSFNQDHFMHHSKLKFKKSLLDNGMLLITESIPHFQSLSIGAWVTAGTRHEQPSEAGLSHFLEHMMFKGTSKRSSLEIAQAVDQVGGEFNAFTAREYTCFHLLLLSKDLYLAADIMADVLINSEFRPEEIERERGVILQEISMVADNPEELVHDRFFEFSFPGHSLGQPILGNTKTVSKFDRSNLVSFFHRHYSPSRTIIAVAGDVRHEEIKRYLNRFLKSERFRKSTKKHGFVSPRLASGCKIIRRDLEQSHIIVGFPGIPYDHPKRFSAFLLNNYLGGGMSSSLFQEIREKRGLAYSVYSSLTPFADTGLFSVYVGTAPSQATTCLEIMGKELQSLRSKLLPQKALEILKNNLKGTILLNSDSVENRMTSIARAQMFFGKYFSISDICKIIDKVNAEDIRVMAQTLFKPKNLILVVLGPEGDRSLPKKLLKYLDH